MNYIDKKKMFKKISDSNQDFASKEKKRSSNRLSITFCYPRVIKCKNEISILDPDNKKELDEKILNQNTTDIQIDTWLSYDNLTWSCELIDFFDGEIILNARNCSLTPGTPVSLGFTFKGLEKKINVKMQGDVLTVEDDGDGSPSLTVKISQANGKAFDIFMKLYSLRQQNINEFFKTAKGL
jgi:hypothetical protein